eukprot:COSAG06_NODE_12668_length_1345_cov_1.586677_1_plen_68_part_00
MLPASILAQQSNQRRAATCRHTQQGNRSLLTVLSVLTDAIGTTDATREAYLMHPVALDESAARLEAT